MSSKLGRPILAGTVAGLSILVAWKYDGWIGLGALGLAGLTAPYAIDRLSESGLDETWQGATYLVKELTYQVPLSSDRPASVKIVRQEAVEKFLKGITETGDLTTPDFWDVKRAKRSAILLGPKNSGKTKIQEFRFQQRVHAGVHSTVSDIHYDAKARDGRDAPDWMPGNREVFERDYLIKSAADTLNYLRYLYQEGRDRIKGKSWTQELHFTIEEWQGCVDEWIEAIREQNGERAKAERDPEDKLVREAVKMVRQIFNQFDKVGIQLDITLHSLTKDRSYLDGSLTDACDLYACGSAITSKQNQFPSDLDAKEMSRERAEAALALSVPQRAIVYRDCQLSIWRLAIAPDLSVEFEFELTEPTEEVWLEQNKERITEMRLRGESRTAIANELKIPILNSDKRWQKLTEFYNSLEAA